ncbi:hypothetical protein [Pseudomonas sp. BLCC-B112]|uniref:hypothetical protein n=1 Tax=Pseudomonas sp. BLCC-B112 TaxID=3025319 RepID=UPI00234C8AD8|nr:hypothetical protein [Pseudomonas sp. BLCC-B112]MDC7818314.1 hypothetical protein [Pseudomonas sp. BLCC-B112]
MESVEVATAVLGWGDILKIVLASGVVATVIGWFKDWLFKSRERARDAKFAAIGVIAKLDLYVIQSRQSVRDYNEVTAGLDPQTHYQDWPRCVYPDLDIAEDELKQLGAEYSSDLAWLATEKALASEHLYSIYDASWDPTEVHAHKAEVVGYFGYEVYLLASKLRAAFGLPPFGLRWGIEDDFQDLLRSWEETKKEVAKRSWPRPTKEK